MSTKVPIKSRARAGGVARFHLYEDVLDSFGEDDVGRPAPVYLRLDGVGVELFTCEGGASVTVSLPRELATALGLLKERT